MTAKSQLEKWATGLLGLVCLLLVLNLALRSGVKAGASRAILPAGRVSPATSRSQALSDRVADELGRYDPVVRLDLLKELQSRPLPKVARNPFEFEAKPAPAIPLGSVGAAVPSAPPPQPTAPPLKAVGYTEKAGGVREAIVSDDQEIYIVHEGETFAKRFRVLKISPSAVEVDDDTTHQTIRLPIPQ
jgi:hypothetical protein